MAKRFDQQFSADERKVWEAGTTKEWADESLAITNIGMEIGIREQF